MPCSTKEEFTGSVINNVSWRMWCILYRKFSVVVLLSFFVVFVVLFVFIVFVDFCCFCRFFIVNDGGVPVLLHGGLYEVGWEDVPHQVHQGVWGSHVTGLLLKLRLQPRK